MSWRTSWKKLGHRDWPSIRDSWSENIPAFAAAPVAPDPGLEKILAQSGLELPKNFEAMLVQDIAGFRSNALAEAVFLFHKCAHIGLATHRVGTSGMHSWGLFNAYHAAYIAAKGTMALLGVSFPRVNGLQYVSDLFPEVERKRGVSSWAVAKFAETTFFKLPGMLEQRYLWESYQRVLNVTTEFKFNGKLRQDLLEIDFEDITPPRNNFLYKVSYWPLGDMMVDGPAIEFGRLGEKDLDPEEVGFLLRLFYTVYRILEQLLTGLAEQCGPIRIELEKSRFIACDVPELREGYTEFVQSIAAVAG